MALADYSGTLAILEAGIRAGAQQREASREREFRLRQLEYQLMFQAYNQVRQEALERQKQLEQTRAQVRQLGIAMKKIDEKAPEQGSTGTDAKEALGQKKDTLEAALIREYKRVEQLQAEQAQLESVLDEYAQAFNKGRKAFFQFSVKDKKDKLGQYNLSIEEIRMLQDSLLEKGIQPGTVTYEAIMNGALAMSREFQPVAKAEADERYREEDLALRWAQYNLRKREFEWRAAQALKKEQAGDVKTQLDIFRSQAEQARAIFKNAAGEDLYIPLPESIGTNIVDVSQAYNTAAMPYLKRVVEARDGKIKDYDKDLYEFIGKIEDLANGDADYVEFNGKIYDAPSAAAFIAKRIHEKSVPTSAFDLAALGMGGQEERTRFMAATDYLYNLARYQVALEVAQGRQPTIYFDGTKSDSKRITPKGGSKKKKKDKKSEAGIWDSLKNLLSASGKIAFYAPNVTGGVGSSYEPGTVASGIGLELSRSLPTPDAIGEGIISGARSAWKAIGPAPDYKDRLRDMGRGFEAAFSGDKKRLNK